VERDEDAEEENLVEIRLKVSALENSKLMAMRRALKNQITKTGIARLLVAYGVENDAAILAWFGERSAEETSAITES